VRAIGRILTAASIAIVGALGVAGGTAADCQGEPPPFAETVASAKQIVIGDVVNVDAGNDAGQGRSRRFTLQVSNVVRGEPAARLDIDNVMTQPCAGDIVAALGDRIALALNATAFTPRSRRTGSRGSEASRPKGSNRPRSRPSTTSPESPCRSPAPPRRPT
jgi:hypothetical protein